MNRTIYPPEKPPFRPVPERDLRDADRIELRVLARAILRRKLIILLFVGLSAAVTLSILSTVRPSYSSFAQVLLNTRQERVVGVEQIVADLTVTNSVVAGEIAVLRSNELLGRVVDRLRLIEHPDFNPHLAPEPNLLQRMAQPLIQWAQKSFGREAEAPPDIADRAAGLSDTDARNLVIWQVRRNLIAMQSGISYVIGISMTAHDPEIAAEIANVVAEEYIQNQLDEKLAATWRAIRWLDTRLQELEQQLRTAEDEVVDFLADQAMRGEGNAESITQQLLELNRAVVVARSERATAELRLAHVRGLMAEGGAAEAAQALSSPHLISLTTERASLARELARNEDRLGPRHPVMQRLHSALADLERDEAAAVLAAIGELEATRVQATGRQTAVEAAISNAHLLQVELSRDSVRLRQLERAASAMRQVYESFLARFQETTQQLEFQRADARIISRAVPPLVPSHPRRQLIVAVALFIGAALGVAAVIVLEVMNQTVRSSADLARVTGLPVLSVLPRGRQLQRDAAWQSRELSRRTLSPYAENLRLLRTSLLNPRNGRRPGTVMFTSVEPGIDCTETVLGLARVVAALGQRVLIVDANFRNPSLHELLRLLPPQATLADYIAGFASREEITVIDAEPCLSVIPAWHSRSDAGDLVTSDRFRTLIERAVLNYDIVLLNAPPVLGLADAKVLAGLAEGVVLVVRAGQTKDDDLVSALFALDEADAVVIGTVLTQADRDDRSRASLRARNRTVEAVR